MAIIIGTSGNDLRRGTAAADVILGLAGDDRLFGDAGNDIVFGGSGDDFVFGEEGNDILFGGTRDDRLSGGLGNDFLFGGEDIDFLEGGAGADLLDGGDGEDTAMYNNDPAGVIVDLQAGEATDGFGNRDRLVGIEDALGSTGNDSFTGDLADNDFLGGKGDDTFNSSDGDDLFDGGEGTDAVIYLSHDAPIRVDLSKEQATDGSGKKDTLKGIENIVGSAFNDRLVGNDQNNDIRGHDGQDVLDGQGGAQDLLFGNDGQDTVSYENDPAGVTVDLGAGAGRDGVGGRDFYNSIESVTGSAHADVLTGDANPNLLDGGPGDDTLIGHAGLVEIGGQPLDSDILRGGDGTDTVSYESDPGGIALFLEEGAGSRDGHGHPDLVQDVEDAIGSSFNDEIVGSSIANKLEGGSGDDRIFGQGGDDILVGGPGNDVLVGGDGNDTVVYRNDPTAVFVRLTLGSATDGFELAPGQFGNDSLFSIENVIGSNRSDFILGNDGGNALTGLDGDDILHGFGGNDTLRGDAGRDEAIFQGKFCEYIVKRNPDGSITVTDKVAGRDGTDVLFDIEEITFDDLIEFDTSKIALGNSAPLPADDHFIIPTEIVPLRLTGTDLLENDCDFDGDVLTIVAIENLAVTGGTAEITLVDGELEAIFTPADGGVVDGGGAGGGDTVLEVDPVPAEPFHASFDYVVDDGHGGMATAGVTIFQSLDVLI